jgi:hypothetical protein
VVARVGPLRERVNDRPWAKRLVETLGGIVQALQGMDSLIAARAYERPAHPQKAWWKELTRLP